MGRKKRNVVIDDDEYSVPEASEESTAAKVEKMAPTGGKKKGKKGNSRGAKDVDEDDDIKLAAEEEDGVSDIVFSGKKKSKSKKGGAGGGFSKVSFDLLGNDDDEDGKDVNDYDDALSEEEDPAVNIAEKSSKGALNDEEDDEHDEVEDGDAVTVNFSGKKKSSKKGSKKGAGGFSGSAFDALGDEDDIDENSEEEEGAEAEVDTPAPSSPGKKKPSKKASKKGGGKTSFSAFDALADEEEDPESTLTGEISQEDGNESDNDQDDAPISFSGKKKKSKKGKKSSGSVFTASNLDAFHEDEDKKDDDEGDVDVDNITFAGKKKKSSKSSKPSGSSFSAAFLDEGEAEAVSDACDEDEDSSVIKFTGKKKSSKKKAGTAFATLGDEADETKPEESNNSKIDTEPDHSKNQNKEAPETSKNKKKKKKGGRTAQEEDELDKILAELGEAPPAVSKPEASSVPPPPQEEKDDIHDQPAGLDEQIADKEDGGGDGVVESAAAKKKRKKKEKEKEKKAAAKVETKEEKPDEKKGKGGPKVPKQVREMQEALQRLKEAEEKKKREEEERLRKEEEERKRQEELEREAEEARRRKKEREKEKALKKKQEGKLLTGKQKEEQRRLEAMRNQFLAKGVSLPAHEVKEKTKRPIYTTKKSKAQHGQTNGAAPAKAENVAEDETKEQGVAEAEPAEMEKEDVTIETEKEEAPVETKENGINEQEDDKDEDDEDDEEWDAKSWDDADLVLPSKSAFEDEEVDTDPEDATAKRSLPPGGNASSATTSKSTAPTNKENPSQETQSRPVVAKKKVPVQNKKDSSDPASEPEQDLRSPICCIMGHVDTGKTKLLDCIRGTNVQEGEAGGITQQIGATYFPAVNIRERTRELKADAKLNVPGLLVIDTPGHESFTNLRSRGSGLCDIAILVVDIMHGLEPQTIESLNLLKMRNTEFIVALNKVDRLYGWKTCRNAPIIKAMKQQTKDVQNEFNQRLTQIVTQFKEQGLNTELYYKNKEMGETYSIIPTSAISGEGIPDMLLLLVQWTQKTMVDKLTYSSEVQCTVLEVKVIEGHGTTIDVILVNGVLHEGDQIVVCGMQGPIATTIRALLTPHPMKELRVKGSYLHHKEIKAAQGIKITAQGLEHAIAGTSLHVVGPDDDLEDIKAAAMDDVESVMSRIDKSGEGVYVQASTLGSLEALLEFLKSPAVKIPVSGIGIGPIHKKDVIRASVMLEKRKEYAAILAFDVKVTPEAREYADELGVKVFTADIIYHLFDQFKAYIQNLKEEQKRESAEEAVFPCVLRIIPTCIFNKKDPIVLGVDILEGILRIGTPICVPSREFICIGKIASIENNHKAVDAAKKGHQVAIKIVGSNAEEQQKSFGRHFEVDDELVSQISRKSIDILKANYREDLSMEDWKLVVKLKTLFKIQ